MRYSNFLAVVIFCAFVCFGFSNTSWGLDLEEGWESATVGPYIPGERAEAIINGDMGTWLVAATIDGTDFCGPIPHQVEIQQINGNKILRLTSGESTQGCSDNIWAVLFTNWGPPVNNNISIPITPDTIFSFEQSGALDPGSNGWGSSCLVPPCYDNISVFVEDTAGNKIVYVLQKYSGWQPNLRDHYREIHLDSSAGFYSRNLYDDFSQIPGFGGNTEIYAISVRVDEHGWCTIDNIAISDNTDSGNSSCDNINGPAVFDDSSDVITNPWLGLVNVGDSYELTGNGTLDGCRQIFSIVGTETIMAVDCMIFRWDEPDCDGQNETYSDDIYIAQDICGNIRVLQVMGDGDGGPFNWQSQTPGDAPIFIPGNPQVGQVLPLLGVEFHEVIALNQTVGPLSTGAGPYSGCMQLNWVDPGEGIDEHYLCPDVGFVKIVWEGDGEMDVWERVSIPVLSDAPDLTCRFGKVQLPSAIVAGTTKGKVQVIITNDGNMAVGKGKTITVELAARPAWAGDNPSSDIVLAVNKGFSVSNLKPGKSKSLNMNVVIPADTPEDEYYLIAKVDTDSDVAESNENNNTSKSEESGAVSAPFVDLAPSVTNPKMPTSVVSGDGTKITLPVVIYNDGNVPCDKGQNIVVTILARPTSNLGDSSEDVMLTMLTSVSISNLKPGKFKKLNVNTYLPAGLAQGDYVIGVQVDSFDDVVESDENNNLAMTPVLSIQPGFIDLVPTISQTKLATEFLQGMGGKGTVKVKVTNHGNVATAKGQKIKVRIVAKSTANSGEWDLTAIKKQMLTISGLKPGKDKTYNGSVVIPTNLPQGTYQIIVTIDSDQQVGESNENNNIIDVQTLKILSAADQLVGTWDVTSIQGAPGRVNGSNSTWTFNANGTYSWFLLYLPDYDVSDSGSYSFDGKTLTVTGAMANQLISGNSVDLTIKNDTFSFRDMDGDRWVYKK